jgi:hypothetical protein
MGHINPDVPKLPRGMVDRIPLVMYIPAPAPAPADVPATEPAASAATVQQDSKGEHVYPPEAAKSKHPRRRFFFFKRMKKESEKNPDVETGADAGWEKNEYPFVKLEANRAACAICLMDFEPPRKVGEQREEPNGAEPLRLLACGHVFHVSISGLCLRGAALMIIGGSRKTALIHG